MLPALKRPQPEAVAAIRERLEAARAEAQTLRKSADAAIAAAKALDEEMEALTHVLTLWGRSTEPAPSPGVDSATENLSVASAIEIVLRGSGPLGHEEVRSRLIAMGVDPARFGPSNRQYFKSVARLDKRKKIDRTPSGKLKLRA